MDIVDKLRKSNPYPKDVFIPMDDEDIKEYVKLLIQNGFSSDQIHAHWMRYSWNLCCDKLKDLRRR